MSFWEEINKLLEVCHKVRYFGLVVGAIFLAFCFILPGSFEENVDRAGEKVALVHEKIGSFFEKINSDSRSVLEGIELYKQAYEFIQNKQYEQAIELCDKAIERNLKREKAYFYRGYVYSKLNDHLRAVQDVSKAIELNSKDKRYYYLRAYEYFELKNYDFALKDLDKVLLLDRRDYYIYSFKGLIYDEMGYEEKAIENYLIAAKKGDREGQGRLEEKGINWREMKAKIKY